MTDQQTCGEALVRLLERWGIDTVFGIPGVHTLELYRGLKNSSIRHVLVRHEQGAGFMADGYARISGRPGVCFVITGPGVTNIATPMGQAYSESVPMLVISTVRATADLNIQQGRLHEIYDQRAVTEPLCAFAATAMSPDELPQLIDRAFAVFQGARPRPVHIEIPLDVLAMPVQEDWLPANSISPPAPDAGQLVSAAEALRKAENPIIIAGGGLCDGAGEGARGLVALAEKLTAPVVTTVAGKGLIADRHPLHLGCTLPQQGTQELLAEADVVLAVGTELAETDTWCDRLPLPETIIRIDIDPGQIDIPHVAAVGVVGDGAAALTGLVTLLGDVQTVDASAIEKRISHIRQAHSEGEDALCQSHRKVLDVMRGALDKTSAIFTDMTQIAYSGNQIYSSPRPRSWFHPSGFGTLGYALPAAIGARLAAPTTPIIALAGDAGFQFTIQELAVAAELDMDLTIVLWNNDALGQIRDDMVAQGIGKVGVEQRNPDFDLLAQAYGVRYLRPDNPRQLAADLARTQAEPGLWLIEVRQADFSV